MKKLSLYIFLVLMFCNVAQALPECEGEDDTQWINCFGTYENKDVSRPGDENKWTRDFTGEFGSVPGKRHGKGSSHIYKDGSFISTYVGEWKDDKPHGQGTESRANGDKYVGEWKDGKKYGQGTETYANGDEYVGEWKDGIWHGQGTFAWASGEFAGDKYVGGYKDGKYHGLGTYTHADETKYVGEYKDDKRHGLGTFTWADGTKYVGEYKDSQPFGYGILITNENKWIGRFDVRPNGFIFRENQKAQVLIGNFKNGVLDEKFENIKPQCKGNYSPQWTNCFGEVIISEAKIIFNTYFLNGNPSSEGAFQILEGGMFPEREGIYVGQFTNGESEGQGVKTWNVSESIYVGEWKNGYMHGKGILRRNDGEIYIGNYKQGKKNGYGTILYSDGKKYEGEFLNSFAHGKGICTFEDERRFNCKMKEGKWVTE